MSLSRWRGGFFFFSSTYSNESDIWMCRWIEWRQTQVRSEIVIRWAFLVESIVLIFSWLRSHFDHTLSHITKKNKHTNSINIYIQSIRNRNYLMWKLSETNIYSYFLFWIQKMETAQTVVIWYISFTFSIKKMARMIVNIAKFAMSESSHQWNLRFANSKLTQIELPSLCAQKCISIQQKPLVDQNIRCKIMPIWRRTTNVKTSVQAHSERIGMNPLGCFSFGFVWSGYSIMAGFAFQTMASFCFCFHNFVLILLDCIQTFELSSNDLVGIELNFVHLEQRY